MSLPAAMYKLATAVEIGLELSFAMQLCLSFPMSNTHIKLSFQLPHRFTLNVYTSLIQSLSAFNQDREG